MCNVLDTATRKRIADLFVTKGHFTNDLLAELNGDDLALLELLGQMERQPKGEIHRGNVFVTTYYLTYEHPEIPMERHDDETQIIHVTMGKLRVTKNGIHTILGPGKKIEIPSGTEHHVVTLAPVSRAWSSYPENE